MIGRLESVSTYIDLGENKNVIRKYDFNFVIGDIFRLL